MLEKEGSSTEKFDTYWLTHSKDGRLVYRQIERNRWFYELLEKYILPLNTKRRALEVGCGTAIDAYYLQNKFNIESIGLDHSKAAVRQAKDLKKYYGQEINLIRGDLGELCFKNETFDLVFSQGVMEHFSQPKQVYREHIRVLKKGGVLVVNVPQKYNLYSLLPNLHIARQKKYGREEPYTIKKFYQIAKEFDLELVTVKGQNLFLIELIRYLYTQFFSKGIENYQQRLKGIAGILSLITNFIENIIWQSLGRYYGQYFMMNIVGVFRKRDLS